MAPLISILVFALRLCVLFAGPLPKSREDVLKVFQSASSVYVTEGANLIRIYNKQLYTKVETLFFTLPDIPDPLRPMAQACDVGGPEADICNFVSQNNKINLDTFNEIKLQNKILTTGGLSALENNDVEIPSSFFDPLEDETRTVQTSKSIGLLQGKSYQQFESLLNKRSYHRQEMKNYKNKRGLAAVAKAGVLLLPYIFEGAKSLGLFSSKEKIADHEVSKEMLAGVSLDSFYKPTSKVSEYFIQGKKFIKDLSSREATIEIDLNEHNKHSQHRRKLASENYMLLRDLQPVIDAMVLEQLTMADHGNLIFYSYRYSEHLIAVSTCQGRNIPLQFVPPTLLRERLTTLQQDIMNNWQIVVGPSDVAIYYKLQLANCIYDSDGGVIEITVPLRPSNVDLELYQIKPMAFGYKEYTCQIDIQEQLITFERNSNKIYAIPSIDASRCMENEFNLCKVNLESVTYTNRCLRAIINFAAAEELIDACPLTCITSQTYASIELSGNKVAVTHLPSQGTEVICDDGFRTSIEHDIVFGTILFTMKCGCSVMYNGLSLGQTDEANCEKNIGNLMIETILPLHWTSLHDQMSTAAGELKDKYTNFDVIFKTNYVNYPDFVERKPLDWKNPIWNIATDALQFLLIIFIFCRLGLSPAMAAFQGANAYPTHQSTECRLPNEDFIIAALIISTTILILQIGWFFFKKIKNVWWRVVDGQVETRLNTAVVSAN